MADKVAVEFGAGVCAGLLSVSAGFPLDTIKTNMQVRSTPLMETVRAIVSKEGYLALFRGLAAPLSSTPIMLGVNIALFQFSQRKYEGLFENMVGRKATDVEKVLSSGLAGATAGGIQCVFSSPFELVKVKMQMYSTNISTYRFANNLYRNMGLKGFYPKPTLRANFVVLSVGSAIFFTVHSSFTLAAARYYGGDDKLTFLNRLMIGGTTGVIYWGCIFPLDLARARMINNSLAANGNVGMFAILRSIVRNCGVKGLFNGCSVALLRSFPTNAIFMSTHAFLTQKYEASRIDFVD